jgi:hypothetical protein
VGGMKVVASPEAAALIRERGGRLFVWAASKACCGGTRFIESATNPPSIAGRFEPIEAEGFELFLRPAGVDLFPDELHIDVKGRRHPHVEAYWNGCAFLV